MLSPLLANIYLHELDVFIEEKLIPRNTKGIRRTTTSEYNRFTGLLYAARRNGDMKRIKKLEQERRQYPSQDTHDPNYRRLAYVRYADDFILGFAGPKSEAYAIKAAIGEFLSKRLHLEMSASKTLITHARTQQAHFLGYAISVTHADGKLSHKANTRTKARSVNGRVHLSIPKGLVREHVHRYQQKGKTQAEKWLLEFSDAHIIVTFQLRYRGLAQYYKYAADRRRLSSLKYVMEVSLVKTLAHKYKTTSKKIYRKYRGKRVVDDYEYKTIQVEVPTSKGIRTIYWGAVPLRVVRSGDETMCDEQYRDTYDRRTDLVRRLQADTCELCDSQENIEVHHIRKLADLKKPGRKEKPVWVKRMIALRRKTLVVCKSCHVAIHAGRPTPNQ